MTYLIRNLHAIYCCYKYNNLFHTNTNLSLDKLVPPRLGPKRTPKSISYQAVVNYRLCISRLVTGNSKHNEVTDDLLCRNLLFRCSEQAGLADIMVMAGEEDYGETNI